MLTHFICCLILDFIQTFSEICSVCSYNRMLLLAIKVEFKSWEWPYIVCLSNIPSLVSIHTAEYNIWILILSRKTFKNWFKIHAWSTPSCPKINYNTRMVLDNFLQMSLILDLKNFSKFWGSKIWHVRHSCVSHSCTAHILSLLRISVVSHRSKLSHHIINTVLVHAWRHHPSHARWHTHWGLVSFLIISWLSNV